MCTALYVSYLKCDVTLLFSDHSTSSPALKNVGMDTLDHFEGTTVQKSELQYYNSAAQPVYTITVMVNHMPKALSVSCRLKTNTHTPTHTHSP